MLTRRTPLKRTPMERTIFKSRSLGPSAFMFRDKRLEERAARALASATPRASVIACAIACTAPVPKDAPLRSEKYRRAVASLPCAHCGITGLSQCAHANTGKGASVKASDLDSFPLCSCQPGRRGCHSLFDQGAMLSKAARRVQEVEWVEQTQRKICALGLWPEGLPMPKEIGSEGVMCD